LTGAKVVCEFDSSCGDAQSVIAPQSISHCVAHLPSVSAWLQDLAMQQETSTMNDAALQIHFTSIPQFLGMALVAQDF
jgi:hypothetical protein